MDSATALEDREVVGAAPSSDELIPPLTRITKVGMCIDKARHDDTALGIDLDRLRNELEILPRVATPRPDDDAVTRRRRRRNGPW